MSAVASTAVTFNNTWIEKHPGGVESRVRQVTVVLTLQGDATDYIGASVLDLNSIRESTLGVATDDGSIYLLAPNTAGSKLLVFDELGDAPVVLTKTLKFIVRGN